MLWELFLNLVSNSIFDTLLEIIMVAILLISLLIIIQPLSAFDCFLGVFLMPIFFPPSSTF